MKTAYIETSAINWVFDSQFDEGRVRLKLEGLGAIAVVGPHVVYELARTFLSAGNLPRGQALFGFLQRLGPTILPSSGDLMRQEVARFRTGSEVTMAVAPAVAESVKKDIADLAAGTMNRNVIEIVSRRDDWIRTNYPKSVRDFLDKIPGFKTEDPDSIKGLRSYEAVYKFFETKIPDMVQDATLGQVDLTEASAIAARIDEFPAIKSGVIGSMILMWICISQIVVPSMDRLDDYRHAIEASYCDYFISHDVNLLSNMGRMNQTTRRFDVLEAFAQSENG